MYFKPLPHYFFHLFDLFKIFSSLLLPLRKINIKAKNTYIWGLIFLKIIFFYEIHIKVNNFLVRLVFRLLLQTI